MGHGLPDRRAEGDRADRAEELAVPHPFRACDRSVMAVLLQSASDGGCVQGGADRQVERAHNVVARIYLPARTVYGEIHCGMCADWGGNVVDGDVRFGNETEGAGLAG